MTRLKDKDMCFGQGCIYRLTTKGKIGSKGLVKDKHKVQGRLFGYMAYKL